MRSLPVLLLAAVALLAPGPARASRLYGVCGNSVCAVDPVRPKRVETVLRGTAKRPYRSVSVSRDGKRMALVRGEEVLRAGRDGRRARRVGTALRQASPEVDVRADGGQLAWIDVVQRPDLLNGGAFLERQLVALKWSAPARRGAVVATELSRAGYLGGRLLRQAFGEAGEPWSICTVTAAAGCVDFVAADAKRSLDDPAGTADGRRVAAVARGWTRAGGTAARVSGPIVLFDARSGRRLRDLTTGPDLDPAFSPDGRTVAFVRGRAVWTVPAAGGRARRLARGMSSPAWASG